jgi:hypothetical protein
VRQLSVTDPDTGEETLIPLTDLQGTYGSISYDDTLGTWTYTLDNTDPDTDALQGAIGENPADGHRYLHLQYALMVPPRMSPSPLPEPTTRPSLPAIPWAAASPKM